MPKNRKAGHLIMFAVTLIFGINIPLTKSLLSASFSPEGLTLARILFATSAFWLVSIFLPQEKVPIKDHGFFLLGSFCGVSLNQGLFVIGLSMTSPIDASIIITSGPLFAMIFAAIILKEPISLLKVSGIFVGASGAILLVYSGHHASNLQASNLIGNLMIFCSAMIYAFYLVFTKPLTQRYSPVTIMKWMFLYASLFVTPIYYSELISSSIFSDPSTISVLQVMYTLIIATFLAYLLIPMAQMRIRPTTISMYNNFQPLIASLVAISVGMDHFSFTKAASALLIFSGVYLVTRSKAKPEADSDTENNIPLVTEPVVVLHTTNLTWKEIHDESRKESEKSGEL